MTNKTETHKALFIILTSYCITLTIAILYLFSTQGSNQYFEEISVKRINIIGENDNNVLVLSNTNKFPPPLLGGMKYTRATQPGGIVFYNEQNGNETGGIAITQKDSVGMRAIVLDYDNMDAIGLLVREEQNVVGRNYYAGLVVNDPGPLGKVGDGKSRISLENDRGTAQLVFKDSLGNPRLALGVLSNGEIFFREKNENNVVIRDLLKEN